MCGAAFVRVAAGSDGQFIHRDGVRSSCTRSLVFSIHAECERFVGSGERENVERAEIELSFEHVCLAASARAFSV